MIIQHTISNSVHSAPSPSPTSRLSQSAFGVKLRATCCFNFGRPGTAKLMGQIAHNHAYWTAGAKAVHFQHWKSAM